jgi:uncharacterized protein
MKIVLDTNVLLVALPRHSPFYPIYKAFLDEKISLCISNEILFEYEEQLSVRYGMTQTDLHLSEIFKMKNVKKIDTYYHWGLISQDPDDNKFVDCAIAANANFLVTNDRHFKILRDVEFPKVNVIKAEEFLTVISTYYL